MFSPFLQMDDFVYGEVSSEPSDDLWGFLRFRFILIKMLFLSVTCLSFVIEEQKQGMKEFFFAFLWRVSLFVKNMFYSILLG